MITFNGKEYLDLETAFHEFHQYCDSIEATYGARLYSDRFVMFIRKPVTFELDETMPMLMLNGEHLSAGIEYVNVLIDINSTAAKAF